MSNEPEYITFTLENYNELKKNYQEAVENEQETFLFQGQHLIVTNYAKYMLEYLKQQFEGPG